MPQTLYDLLGVAPDASDAEIRAAYREQLKTAHPDVSDDADAGERTRRLVRARDVLLDPDERARYDRLGHEEYVGEREPGEERQSGSDAAAAARRAGYGGRRSGSESGAWEPDPEAARERAQARRERERRASERVAEDRQQAASSEAGGDPSGSSASTGEQSARSATAEAAPGATSAAGTRVGGVGPGWQFATGSRSRRQSSRQRFDDWVPSGHDLTLLGITFALFPVLLFSALLPAFPVLVNLVVGLSLLVFVGYLQSRPRVAVLVFGPWSIVTPLALVSLGVPFVSVIGLLALCSTWLPFGFTLLTIAVMEP